MTVIDRLLLLLLASIWGSSFIFMRHLAPVLGPIVTATVRSLAAGLVLSGIFSATKTGLDWKRHGRHYLVVGLLNSAIPFMLFAWAALGIPAAISSVANAMSPLWGSIFAALLIGEKITPRKAAGLALGIAGVAVISFSKGGSSGEIALLPVLACVLATVLYGFSGVYIRRWGREVPSRSLTAASLLVAGMALLPLALVTGTTVAVPAAGDWILAVVFSLLCSGAAYLIYFRLISSAGVTKALSVTLLIPVFAFLWGYLFLGESVSPVALAGAALVLSGTALLTRNVKQADGNRI